MYKKRILKVLLTLTIALSVPITTFAATHYYSGVVLPRFSGNWQSPNRTKQTDDKHFVHQLTRMGSDYEYVNAWQILILYDQLEITAKAKHKVGDDPQKVHWKNNVVGARGATTNLRLENATFTYVTVEATGNYDLR